MTTVTTGAAGTHPLEPPAGFQPEQPKSLLSYAKYVDPLMMFAWVLSTTMTFGGLGPLRYLAAAYFAGALFLFGRQTMPSVARSWPLFLLPILCTISAFWAPSTDEALRKGIALAMTGLVAIYVATRIKGRHILLAYFSAELIAALMSLRTPVVYQGAWTGIFGQKNFYAIHMFILYVCAMGVAFDREQGKWIQRLATAVIPLAAFMTLMAKSGTTTLMMVGATAVIAGQHFVWRPAARIHHARLLVIMIATVLILIGLYIAIGLLQLDPKEEILSALGKDSSLTGRTMLWELAERVMREHPWTGVGANGFWRAEYGLANSVVTQELGMPTFTGFSFHNSYYENGANYGYPGYWATVFLSAWALTSSVLNWVRNQSIVNASFLVFAAMIILRTTSEADLSGEFSGTAVLLFIAAARKEFRQPKLPTSIAPGKTLAPGQAIS